MRKKSTSVEVRLPSQLGYEKVAMSTAAAVAKLMGFREDRVEDLKTAVQQPCDLTTCLQQPRIEIRRFSTRVVGINRGENQRPAVGTRRLDE